MRRALGLFFLLLLASSLWAGVGAKKRELAVAAKQNAGSRVVSISRELLRTGEPEAVEAVIKYGLRCDDYQAERALAGELAVLSGELRGVVRKAALQSPDYRIRVVLSAVLAAYDDKASFEALCVLAGDPAPPVALASISHLVKKAYRTHDKRVVDGLIQALKRYEKRGGVVAAELQRALRRITGGTCTSATEWEKWWAPRRKHFEFEDAQNRKESGSRTFVKSRSFFGHEIVSKRILFILDMSGSMKLRDYPPEKTTPAKEEAGGGRTVVRKPKEQDSKEKEKAQRKKREDLPITRQRLYRVQKELKKTIRQLTPDTRFTVMAFNHEIKMLTGKPKYAKKSFKKDALRFVDRFKPEGETWTDKALEKAFEKKDLVNTIYLLSDGYPQREQKFLDTEKILKFVKRENRFRKIKIYTVGFKQGGRQMRRFLSRLAEQNGGTYKQLE